MSTFKSVVTGIAHVGIRVHSLQRSRTFYEALGFDFVAGPIGPEPVAILEHPCGVVINLILNAPSESEPNVLMDVPHKHPGYTHIALEVADIGEAQQALEQAGMTVTEGPVRFANGTLAVFVRDPDRNVIEFDQLPR